VRGGPLRPGEDHGVPAASLRGRQPPFVANLRGRDRSPCQSCFCDSPLLSRASRVIAGVALRSRRAAPADDGCPSDGDHPAVRGETIAFAAERSWPPPRAWLSVLRATSC
jgi:hypothetical protein